MNLRTFLRRALFSSGLNNRVFISLIAGLIAISGPLALIDSAAANTYEQRIRALQSENISATTSQMELQTRAESLSEEIANLRQNIKNIEQQIKDSRAKHAEIEEKITALESEIDQHRATLGKNIRQMYLDDQMSTIEKLASSKNLSDYVDKQQYRVSIQSKIQETMSTINELKDAQEKEKQAVEKLIADRQVMQSDLEAERRESERLLALNKRQQNEFESNIRANNSKIAQLRRQQAAENSRHFVSAPRTSSGPIRGGGGDTYPWANVPFPNRMVDPWGMYKRQCVSYTAWKVHSSGRHMPYWGGRGNAKLWANNARQAGIPVSRTPRVGDVAVSTAGTYGHVMYVEAVHGDGTITISDYNANWDGRYRLGRRTTHGLEFIHFR